MEFTLCCISLDRCCFGLETRVIIKISTHSWYPRTFVSSTFLHFKKYKNFLYRSLFLLYGMYWYWYRTTKAMVVDDICSFSLNVCKRKWVTTAEIIYILGGFNFRNPRLFSWIESRPSQHVQPQIDKNAGTKAMTNSAWKAIPQRSVINFSLKSYKIGFIA